ncbi:ATP-dependent RNA helicase HrpB [Rosistilla oblonga]|uniref:ATP-dependent RNA helicase HrpA n=1 Tax=Rosistilla oblonga TaxID=2527990 RepID=UPI00118D3154|nr:ATP-dependent RNA helicase HrpA [Rosistilla oblonga]QDV14463.1 ATP-dependent RNA helicase HrpB [Rosistilla oblonga]
MPAPDTSAIDQRIAQAMRSDRFRLQRQLRQLSHVNDDPQQIERFREQLEESVALAELRAASIPQITYPEELPVSSQRDTIVELIRTRPAVIVCGETGSGKSTQLPKMCLDAGLGRSGMIGHTQPRRIAARSIASRVAEELGTSVGQLVGYKIRFADQTAPTSLIKLMTDGILLAETQSDRFLDQYDAIILDEAHERSLNIDFLLGIFSRLLQKRSDLRLIITSATIDAERFANHFRDEHGPAPIVNVEGRSYPVDIQYLPSFQSSENGDDRGQGIAAHVAAGVDEAWAHGVGDTLVFLPTERDIREVARHLGGHLRRQGLENRTDILPLYARLPASEQQKIFHGSNKPRIVLATNVAESSLTVPGIRYVVDTGTARISRYSPRSKVQRLPVEAVSRASADQRAGRCGRVGPGICIRLYDQDDYESREHFTTPEIRRTNLASVILQTKMMRLGSIDEFPFLDAPRPESISEGFRTLHEIGAIDERRELTKMGRVLGSLPVDPRVGRMIIEADQRGCLPEMLVIAAALEVQDPRIRPPEKQQAADAAHAKFVDQRSDFLSYLRIWRFYRGLQEDLSRNRLARACQTNFLGLSRMREWVDVHRQLKAMVPDLRRQQADKRGKRRRGGSERGDGEHGLSNVRVTDACEPDQATVDDNLYASIHQSLLTGLLSGVAMAGEKHQYIGIGNQEFFLWPGSGVFESKPKWIVAGELVETSKRFVRNVARIDPGWLEPLAEHLVKRSYADPFWSRKDQSAFCYERVSLFGLPIVVKRRKALAPIDPETAQRLLIDEGLVAGELVTRAKFYAHNQQLREVIAKLAHKTRRRDLIVDDYIVEHFYHAQLPSDVVDRSSLQKFDEQQPRPDWVDLCQSESDLVAWLDQPLDAGESSSLYMRPADLLPGLVEKLDPNAFPDHLQVGPTSLPLQYNFDPSADNDGVTVTIPKVLLGQISDDRLGWLVPGLIETKLIAMIKALPKRIRRNLVPAADSARRVLESLDDQMGQTAFMSTVCQRLAEIAEVPISPSDFDPDKLPESVGFYIRVVDDDGKPLGEGRDLQELRQEVIGDDEASPGSMASVVDVPDDVLQVDGLKDFTIDNLPERVERERGGVRVTLFPALVDQGDSVAVRLVDNAASAEHQMRRGLVRLFTLTDRSEINKQVRWLPGFDQAAVQLSRVIPGDSIKQGLADLIANIAFVDRQPLIRSRSEFEARRKNRGERIAMATQDIAKLLGPLAESYHGVRLSMEACKAGHLAYVRDDIKRQLSELFRDDFWLTTRMETLKQYPRYLKAISVRLEKLSSTANRDRDAHNIVAAFQDDYFRRTESYTVDRAVLDEYRWMIEELRVSLFAQTLGTAIKVSPQRLEKLRAKLDKS